jgi:hypothetical protein
VKEDIVVIDYDDLVECGMIKAAHVRKKTADDIYAVLINYPKTKVGKFCITTKEDTLNSIEALQNVILPEAIEKPARYYVKQAAIHFGIPAGWDCEKCAQDVSHEVLLEKTASEETEYRLKFANELFFLRTDTEIKLAEEHYLGILPTLTIKDRCAAAAALCKEGAYNNYRPSDTTKAYSRPELGWIEGEIEYRKVAARDNNEYLTKLSKLYKYAAIHDPLTFVENVRSLDKAAGLQPELDGHPYSRFFTDSNPETVINSEAISKLAEYIDPSAKREDIDRILKLI